MKLAYFYRNLNHGGIQRMIVNAANYFAAQGHDVSVVLMRSGGEYIELLSKNVKVIYFKSSNKTLLFKSFSSILRQEQFDLLFTATPSLNTFTVLGRFFSGVRTRIVISERNNTTVFFRNSSLTLSKMTFIAIPFLYRFADAIVAVSRGLALSLNKIALVSPDKIHVIYNPVWTPQLEEQSRLDVQHEWFDTDVPVIITAGRLVAAKNHSLLIDAIALLRKRMKVRLLIVGDGVLRSSLEAKIKDQNLDDCVRLEGFKLNPVAWMSKADLFVLSSDYEGFGNVLVEALAAGLTIVSTDCDFGPSEILEGGFGYLTPVGDAVALAATIELALKNPIDKFKLRERAKRFGAQDIMKRYDELFGRLLS